MSIQDRVRVSVTSTTAQLSGTVKEIISKNPQTINKIRQIVETAQGSINKVPEYREPAMKWIRDRGEDIVHQLQEPDTQKAIMVSAASFAVSKAAFYYLGFGPLGPVAGLLAPRWQSYFFGGYIPPGSWFSTLQHLGNTGQLNNIATAVSSLAATGAGASVVFEWDVFHGV